MNSLTLLIKPASASCNLRCGYCFYRDVSDNRNVKNYGIMTESVAETLIKKAFATGARHISFSFQGGEPTLAGLDFFRSFVDNAQCAMHNAQLRSETERKFPSGGVVARSDGVAWSIQTNGILIDEEWARFLKENRFLTGISLDGPKDIHDLNRRDAAGEGTFNRVTNAARLLKKIGAEFNVLTVVTNHTARHAAKIYNFFKAQGYGYLQFIPCLDEFDCKGEPRLSVENYAYFLKTLFGLWLADYKRGDYISVRHIDNYVRMMAGQRPESCAMGGKCGTYFVVESDGGLYPCDFYCTDKHRVGSVMDANPLAETEKHTRFIADSLKLNAECTACQYYLICRGGCKRDREPSLAENRFCAAYKEFFAHALTDMKKIAAKLDR